MRNPVFGAGERATTLSILIPRESRFVTSNACCASSGSLFRRRGATSGFVRRLMGTSRPPDGMRGDGNSIDITSAGGKYGMRTNTIDWSTSEKLSQKFADAERKIWL